MKLSAGLNCSSLRYLHLALPRLTLSPSFIFILLEIQDFAQIDASFLAQLLIGHGRVVHQARERKLGRITLPSLIGAYGHLEPLAVRQRLSRYRLDV